MQITERLTERKHRGSADPRKFNEAALRAARHGPTRYAALDDLAGELPERVLREITAEFDQ